MSSALAISGVTAVIRHLLHEVYSTTSLGGAVRVSAKAPDIVQADLGSDPQLQLNVFLHQVTLNAAWRNMGLPSLAADGQTVLKTPPLALDLHYLLTAYATHDMQAEAILGYAVQLLHENPVLTRPQISAALASIPSVNPLHAILGSSGLGSQFEMLKITPATLGREEMAWLWTALKADYRPTFPFQVSVVLIERPAAASSGLPVLRRKVVAQTGLTIPSPAITGVQPPKGQPAASQGDTVSVQGSDLAGASTVMLSNPQLAVRFSIVPVPASVTPTSLNFTLPNPPAAKLPAGIYALTIQVTSGTDTLSTNSVPLMIAPKIISVVPGTMPAGPANLTVSCTPDLQFGQQVSLLIGGQGAPATNLPTDPTKPAVNAPSFTFPALQATHAHVPVWLRVDGVDGPTIDFTMTPPAFAAPTTQVT